MENKKALGCLYKIIVAFILYIIGIWVGLAYCKYSNDGWCGDLSPIGALFTGIFFGPVSYLILVGISMFIDKKKRFWLPVLICILLLVIEGSFFNFSDLRRLRLIQASEQGDIPSMRYWLSVGASPDSHGFHGVENALERAVRSGSGEAVKLLLEKGANPDQGSNCDIYHPLSLAYQLHNEQMVKLLKQFGAHEPCLLKQKDLIENYGRKQSDFEMKIEAK